MGFSSAWHWIIVLLVVLIVFGAGRLPRVMGDVAKGIKTFKAGLKDEDEPVVTPTTTTSASPEYRSPEYKAEIHEVRPDPLSPRQPV